MNEPWFKRLNFNITTTRVLFRIGIVMSSSQDFMMIVKSKKVYFSDYILALAQIGFTRND